MQTNHEEDIGAGDDAAQKLARALQLFSLYGRKVRRPTTESQAGKLVKKMGASVQGLIWHQDAFKIAVIAH